MSSQKAVLVCHQPREPKWRLQPPVSGTLMLVDQRAPLDQEREAGVPDEVASLLARALTDVALVSFPCSSERVSTDKDHVRVLGPTGLRERLESAFSGAPSRVVFVSTRQPDVTKTLFDDAAFPWWLQGQIAVLSAPDAPPPRVDRRALLGLIEPLHSVDLEALSFQGVAGLMRPGVDGDVAGILASTSDFERQVQEAIRNEAVARGIEWQVVSEDAFTEQLAAPGS
jgi:hypothetical protein